MTDVEDRAAAIVRAWASASSRPTIAGKIAILQAARDLLLEDHDPDELEWNAGAYGHLGEAPERFGSWVRAGGTTVPESTGRVIRAWWAVE